jgi:hypothetical protein
LIRRSLTLLLTALSVAGMTLPAEAANVKVCVFSNDHYTFGDMLTLTGPGPGAVVSADLDWDERCVAVDSSTIIPTIGDASHERSGTYLGTCLLGLWRIGDLPGTNLVLIGGSVLVGVGVAADNSFVSAGVHIAEPDEICAETSATARPDLPSGGGIVVTPEV